MSNPVYRIEGFIGEDMATSANVAAFLAENPGPVEFVVNSPGGNATEGAAILAELEAHGGALVSIRGIAASAASLVAMGGKTINMHRDALLMIHDPSAMTVGTAKTHRETASTLDKLADTYAAAYARASGNPKARIRQWMIAETWMTAEEAVALDFADAIEEPAPESQITAVAAFDFTRFKNAPDELVQLAIRNGWATEPPRTSIKEIQNA